MWPFHDTPSFIAWILSNALWVLANDLFGALVVAAASVLGFRFALGWRWNRVLWAVLSIFIASLTCLALLRPTQPTAKLEPAIMGVGHGGTLDGDGQSTVNNTIILFMKIANKGDRPSSVSDLKIEAMINGESHIGKIMRLPKAFEFNENGVISKFTEEDALYKKIERKIDSGDVVTGMLMVGFDGIKEEDLTYGSTEIMVSVFDLDNKVTMASQKLTKTGGQREIHAFPGLYPK